MNSTKSRSSYANSKNSFTTGNNRHNNTSSSSHHDASLTTHYRRRTNNQNKNQAISIRDGMIRDPESTDTLLYMVQMGREMLEQQVHYKTYRTVLAEMIRDKDYFDERKKVLEANSGVGSVFTNMLWGEEGQLLKDPQFNDFQIDAYIEEVLRFIAMKIFLENEVITADSKLHDEERKEKGQIPVVQLRPSLPVKNAWRTLILFPLAYDQVCKAMGCMTHLDYSEEDEEELNDFLSTKMWNMECYCWTIGTYTKLYKGEPSRNFWPPVKVDLNSGEILYETREVEYTTSQWSRAMQNVSKKFIDRVQQPCAGYEIGVGVPGGGAGNDIRVPTTVTTKRR